MGRGVAASGMRKLNVAMAHGPVLQAARRQLCSGAESARGNVIKQLPRLWRRVHPDLFARWPEARAANERSMQNLRALLDVASEQQRALRAGGTALQATPPAQELRFFVLCEDEKEAPLREVSAAWHPPSIRKVMEGDAWRRSAEVCVAALLQRVDPSGDWTADVSYQQHHRPVGDGVQGADPLHAASIAARQRRREQQPSDSSRPNTPYAPRPAGAGGGELRRELLFFHRVPPTQRPRAIARLESLMRDALEAGCEHGPLLLCGGAPPESAAARGFACISVDADVHALRRSLARALGSHAEATGATQTFAGDAAIASSHELRARLGCEEVEWSRELSVAEARQICDELLPQASLLRAALDAIPWHGLHLCLEPRSARSSAGHGQVGDSADVVLTDAACGGALLVVRGEAGARKILPFARREWRALRLAQNRHKLSEELRRRLGCRAVHAIGVPDATWHQCDALRALLRVLRERAVLIPTEGDAMADATLTIGGDPPLGEMALGRADLRLWLPSAFNANEALALLLRHDVAHARTHPKVTRRRGRAGGPAGAAATTPRTARAGRGPRRSRSR